jgi:hypothetical protein
MAFLQTHILVTRFDCKGGVIAIWIVSAEHRDRSVSVWPHSQRQFKDFITRQDFLQLDAKRVLGEVAALFDETPPNTQRSNFALPDGWMAGGTGSLRRLRGAEGRGTHWLENRPIPPAVEA